jgi:hypothetical protein
MSAIGNINKNLWERFAQANRQKGLTIHATLEKLITVWLDVYGPEEFRIPREIFKPDFMGIEEGKRLVTKKMKEIRK